MHETYEFIGNQSFQEVMEELVKCLVKSGMLGLDNEISEPKKGHCW